MVVRADISPGQQATQSTHAAFAFSVEHPLLMEQWFRESTYLVLLAVPDEEALKEVTVLLDASDQAYTTWHEPDMDDSLTAIAVAPSEATRRLLARYPLTLRETQLA